MEKYARLAKATSIDPVSIARPFSLFNFVDIKFNQLETLRRILTQARCLGVQTIVIETLEPSLELVEENEDIQRVTASSFTSKAYRLSFFSKRVLHRAAVRELPEEAFVGYAIVKRDGVKGKLNPCHIYESVIRKSQKDHNYVRGEQTWACRVGSRLYKVNGYLYAQQNGLTNVCAQATLRTVGARFIEDHNLSYRNINGIVGINHKTKFATGGMRSSEITKVLNEIGAGFFVGSFKSGSKPPAPFHRLLYSSIESGFPAIVFFETHNKDHHVIPIFGHTFNQDTWVPSAELKYFTMAPESTGYIYSDAWLSMFIGHDDNVGSNLCIPRHYLQTKARPSGAPNAKEESVTYIISTAPKSTELYFTIAETAAIDALSKILPQIPTTGDDLWLTRIRDWSAKGQLHLVVRPLLISAANYIDHLRAISDWNRRPVLPDGIRKMEAWIANSLLWMIEFSVPELFSATKRKIGEVLVLADKRMTQPTDVKNLIAARVFGVFALPKIANDGTKNKQEFEFYPSGLTGHAGVYGCE